MRHLTFLAVAILAATTCSCSSSSSDNGNAGTTVTQDIGPEGGTITVGGATITFPAGALTLKRTFTINVSDTQPPAGYVMLSKFIKCEPSGTDFAQKVSMQMPFQDDGQQPITVFWSSGAQPAFTDVGGTKNGDGTITAEVEHFSAGFVGRKK